MFPNFHSEFSFQNREEHRALFEAKLIRQADNRLIPESRDQPRSATEKPLADTEFN
jgi:hypothetical protein